MKRVAPVCFGGLLCLPGLVPGSALDSFCTSGEAIPANVGGPLTSNPIAALYIFADNFDVYHRD